MSKILIAEDDTRLAEVLSEALSGLGHSVEVAGDGEDALERVKLYDYDVLILDWGLPLLSGMDVLKKFRAQGGTSPIIMLTAKDKLDEKTSGLNAGADDYLTKPFELPELIARVRALLRRPPVSVVSDKVVVGDITLDSVKRQVSKAGHEVKLKPKEFALLEFLMRNRGKIFSADQLIKAVWTADEPIGSETVRTHIKNLRSKLESDGAPPLIVNVFAVGYKIEADNI